MRGCPYPCEFCSVSTANGTTMRFRPVQEVLDELNTLSKLILFADDNVMIHRKYSAELFTRMIPLQKHWIGQCSLAAVKRIENVQKTTVSMRRRWTRGCGPGITPLKRQDIERCYEAIALLARAGAKLDRDHWRERGKDGSVLLEKIDSDARVRAALRGDML